MRGAATPPATRKGGRRQDGVLDVLSLSSARGDVAYRPYSGSATSGQHQAATVVQKIVRGNSSRKLLADAEENSDGTITHQLNPQETPSTVQAMSSTGDDKQSEVTRS